MRLVRDIARATAWLAATGAVLLLFQTGLISPGVPRVVRGIMAALLLLTFARPGDGLLAAAALIPVASAAAMVLHVPSPGRWSELVVLTLLGGFLLHSARHRARPLDSDVGDPAIVSFVVVLASFVVHTAASAIEFEPNRGQLWRLAVHDYFLGNEALRVVTDGMPFVEGVALFWFVARRCAQQPELRERVARMLSVGAAGAATINALVLVTASLRPGLFWTLLGRHLTGTRINLQYGDLNAAGSYFALTLFVALGVLYGSRRPHWWLATGTIALALWMSGSRAALLAVLLVTAAGLSLAAARRTRTPRARHAAAVALLMVLIATTATAVYLARATPHRPADDAIKIRLELASAAARMVQDYPLFGIGLSRFYVRSEEYLAGWFRNNYYPRENAHNNVLQIAAELGLVGLAALACLVIAVARRFLRTTLPPVGLGVVAGLTAFLLTALAGHPLLTREVAYTFWLAFGLAAAYGRPAPHGSRVRVAAIVALAGVLISVPFRVRTESIALRSEHAAWGVSLWTPAASGPRTRTVGRRAVFFVPADARGVILPFRSRLESAAPHTIELFFEGRLANRVTTKSVEWIRVNLVLPAQHDTKYYRIEAHVTGPVPPGADTSVDAGVEMGWIQPTR